NAITVAIEECARILEQGGLLLISVPAIRTPLSGKHFQHFSLAALKELFSGHFQLESVSFRLGRWRWEVLSKWLDNRLFSVKPLARLFHHMYLNPAKESDASQIVTRWRKRTKRVSLHC